MSTSFEKFRLHRALLSWIGHTRPYLLVRANKISKVAKQTFSTQTVNEFNTAVKLAKRNSKKVLVYGILEKVTVHIRCYADASFAFNDNLSSQVGFIVVLCESIDQ